MPSLEAVASTAATATTALPWQQRSTQGNSNGALGTAAGPADTGGGYAGGVIGTTVAGIGAGSSTGRSQGRGGAAAAGASVGAVRGLTSNLRTLWLLALLLPLALPLLRLQHSPSLSQLQLSGLSSLQLPSLGFSPPSSKLWRSDMGLSDAVAAASRSIRASASKNPPSPSPTGTNDHSSAPGDAPLGPGGWHPGAAVRVVTIVPRGTGSPYKATWGEVAAHTAQRLAWSDPSFEMQVFHEEDLTGDGGGVRLQLLEALGSGCQVSPLMFTGKAWLK